MPDKNRKDAALDSTNEKGAIEYTPEQVEEHEKRERKAAQINKKAEKEREEVAPLVGPPEPPEEKNGGKRKH